MMLKNFLSSWLFVLFFVDLRVPLLIETSRKRVLNVPDLHLHAVIHDRNDVESARRQIAHTHLEIGVGCATEKRLLVLR